MPKLHPAKCDERHVWRKYYETKQCWESETTLKSFEDISIDLALLGWNVHPSTLRKWESYDHPEIFAQRRKYTVRKPSHKPASSSPLVTQAQTASLPEIPSGDAIEELQGAPAATTAAPAEDLWAAFYRKDPAKMLRERMASRGHQFYRNRFQRQRRRGSAK